MWCLLTVTVALFVVAGCTRADPLSDADHPSVEPALTTTIVTTTLPTTIAVAPSSTSTSSTPVTTTIVTIADDRLSSTSSTTTPLPTTPGEFGGPALRADGIGQIAFGTPETDALAVMGAVLGDVASDTSNTYAVDRGDGTYLDDASGEVFTHPAQHTACFDNALCVVFGGVAADTLTFVGWVQNNQGVGPPLTTIDGVAAGSTWADHVDVLDVADSGCYSVGYGTTSGGIGVELLSAGDPFLAYDDDGNEIPTEPDPADVTVTQLSAGTRPGNPEEEDC
jgi:hypothetical protein